MATQTAPHSGPRGQAGPAQIHRPTRDLAAARREGRRKLRNSRLVEKLLLTFTAGNAEEAEELLGHKEAALGQEPSPEVSR